MIAKVTSSSVPCTPSPYKGGQIQKLQGSEDRGAALVDLDTPKDNNIWSFEATGGDVAEAGESPRREDFNTTQSWYIKGHNKYPPSREATLVSAQYLFGAGAHSPIV